MRRLTLEFPANYYGTPLWIMEVYRKFKNRRERERNNDFTITSRFHAFSVSDKRQL